MAQGRNRQPVYSADTLALRYVSGLMLIALGVMIFLAVELRMTGNVFDALRQVCYGLTGGLAVLLPVLPVWAGVLVIWSSQRKAPVKPFVYGSLAYLALCTFIVLVTRIGSTEYLAGLAARSDGSWGGVILQGYLQSITLKASGGAVGITLAYPFWSLVGTILGAVIVLLLLIFCLLLTVNLTPARIRDLATGRISLRAGRNGTERADQDQRQIAFQQEQEKQRQAAYAQRQAYMLQQQQAQAAARQNAGGWNQISGEQIRANGQVPVDGHRGWTGTNPSLGNPDVQDWQQQLTDQTAARKNAGRKSSIFDRTDTGKTAGKSRIFDQAGTGPDAGSGNQQARTAGGSAIFGGEAGQTGAKLGRLFGRGRKESDGLSDLSEEEKRREGMTYPAGNRLKARQAASKVPQDPMEEDLAPWKNPAADQHSQDAGQTEKKENGIPKREIRKAGSFGPDSETPLNPPAEQRIGTETGARTTPEKTARKPKSANSGAWMDQVIAAQNADNEAYPAENREEAAAGRKREAEQLKIPVAAETIADPVWKPELKRVEKKEEPEEEYWEPTPYYAPPITDLKKPENNTLDTSQEDADRSARLEEILMNFRVQARVVHVTHGPAISRFELELAPGTKVGKVAELGKDIAYGMQATSVRIEAPIPGKSLVGVEVPNPKRATVTLREVLESDPMQNARSILTVALGRDIAGTPIVCDLAKMPHMLIAGATGSGKSVCINTIINSLLFRAGPDEVKLILVDPKVVELQCYNGIPHLLLPVVNDPHKAAAALAWAVAEMMERYDKFAERGVRNLDGYNQILGPGEKPMPRIVIIIDELADLMMVCKKDVEEYICRLTQLARAAGIHLIVATQRPSVDVITGLIKANIPSRIAFKTAQSVDSRTILDRNGSEQLLGLGDMLYLPTGAFAPIRIQGCFLSDEEVNRIADHVRQANPSTYDPDILDKLEQLSRGAEETPTMDMVGGAPESSDGDADLFAQAVEYAIADGQISISTLQRRLKVGYARAGRLTDEMEERGIVSAKDGSKPRKCLITREEWENMKAMGD